MTFDIAKNLLQEKLAEAISGGNFSEAVGALINGANPNVPTFYSLQLAGSNSFTSRVTLLEFALARQRTDIVKALLQRNASAFVHHQMPLKIAIFNHSKDTVSWLLSRSASLKYDSSYIFPWRKLEPKFSQADLEILKMLHNFQSLSLETVQRALQNFAYPTDHSHVLRQMEAYKIKEALSVMRPKTIPPLVENEEKRVGRGKQRL